MSTDHPTRAPLPTPEQDLERLVAASLRSREPAPADVAAAAARIQERLAREPLAPTAPTVVRHGSRVAAVALVSTTLAVAGASAAAATAAANPYSGFARVVEDVAETVGIEWSAMPAGYTREQYEAFWGAGYTVQDIEALAALWSTDTTETKARAGQLLLDGDAVPVAPGASQGGASQGGAASGDPDPTADAFAAYFAAGYTYDDAVVLAELWQLDVAESKVRAGEMLLGGEDVPVEPGSAPAAPTAP